MKRGLFVLLLTLSLVSVVAAAGAPPGMEGALPLNATVVVTHEADLTGDGRPELIVGYAMPTGTNTRPPTEGRAAVLERTPAGDYRRFDLQGGWPGHYPPHFTVTDLTGDGRPELVLKVAGGGAWGMGARR